MENKLDIVTTAKEYIENTKNNIENIICHFQNGEEYIGFQMLPSIIDDIGRTLDSVALVKESQKKKIEFEEVNNKLREIVQALINKDYILIGDLLEYELLSILEDIKSDISLSIS